MTNKITVVGDRPLQHYKNINAFFKKVIETAREHNLEPIDVPKVRGEKPSLNGRPRITLVTKEYNEAARLARESVVIKDTVSQEEVVSEVDEPTIAVESEQEAASESVTEQETVADPLETLKTKDELLAYAKEIGIEIPEEMNKPLAIKKFIRENTSK